MMGAFRVALGRWWRFGFVAMVVIGAGWALAGPASAHTGLASSSPADGDVVTDPLERITFTFTGQVEPFVDGFALVGPDGSSLPIAFVEQPEPATVVVVPTEPIVVSVEATWAIVSGDSHPITGVIVVGVDAPPPTTTSTTTQQPVTTSEATTAPTTSTTTTTAAVVGGDDGSGAAPNGPAATDVEEEMEMLRDRATDESTRVTHLVSGIIRWITYAATAAIIGGATLAIVAGARGATIWEGARRWLWVAVIALAASTAVSVGAQLSQLTGNTTDLWSVAAWGDVFDGRFRVGVLVRLAGAALVAFAFSSHGIRRVGFFAIGATAIVSSYPILGHTTEGSAWIATPATMVHVAAISIWVGGLGTVLIVGAHAARSHFVAVVRTFSGLAGVALAATIVTGAGLAVVRLQAISELWGSTYGQRLALKIVLVVMVVALGALHRFRTVPALDAGRESATTGFNRLALVEAIGFAGVLAATGWLVIAASPS